jgi:predicted SAM-dependent methyltransferase
MDATQPFPFEAGRFDFIFSEHMIEHVPLEGGRAMLAECYRVMAPGGRIRISCPERAFIERLVSGELSEAERYYVDWCCSHFGFQSATAVGCNLAVGFGHKHIYSGEELARELERAGFRQPTFWRLCVSSYPELGGLENVGRLPPGFLQLESMTAEAGKPAA